MTRPQTLPHKAVIKSRLIAGGSDFAGCKGKTITAPAGWNNSASSVRLDGGSRMPLYNHGWGGDKLFELKGNLDAKADLKGGADNHTPLLVCD